MTSLQSVEYLLKFSKDEKTLGPISDWSIPPSLLSLIRSTNPLCSFHSVSFTLVSPSSRNISVALHRRSLSVAKHSVGSVRRSLRSLGAPSGRPTHV